MMKQDDPNARPTRIKHLAVGTPFSHYAVACYFERPFFVVFPLWVIQVLRIGFGMYFALVVVEEFFAGPTDAFLISAYLSTWANFFSFLTMLY